MAEASSHFCPKPNSKSTSRLCSVPPTGWIRAQLLSCMGARFDSVASWDQFRQALRTGISRKGLSIIEAPTDRSRNVELHRRIWRSVSGALAHNEALRTAF